MWGFPHIGFLQVFLQHVLLPGDPTICKAELLTDEKSCFPRSFSTDLVSDFQENIAHASPTSDVTEVNFTYILFYFGKQMKLNNLSVLIFAVDFPGKIATIHPNIWVYTKSIFEK